ncbi:MAG TPA: TIR domain-containing protein [Casimicrobiaceae bacterium]
MKGIFISYRREDSAGYAGRLYDRLAAHFGADRVFMDVEGIEPGTDFIDAIGRAVGSCEVLIVIIGNEWLATDSKGKSRLDDPSDFVRIETAAALTRGIRVLPVLVEGAVMPRADQLPTPLAPLARRQAVELSHKQWDATTGELIRTLEKILNANKPQSASAAAPDAGSPSATPELRPEVESPGAGGVLAFIRRNWWIGAGLVLGVAVYLSVPWSKFTKPVPRAGHLVVAPSKLEFPDQLQRVPGPAATITLRNDGEGPLRVIGPRLDGAITEFEFRDDQCSSRTLAPANSCSMRIIFNPQNTGLRSATLAFNTDPADTGPNPAVVSIQGRGTAPALAEAARPPAEKAPDLPPPRAPAVPQAVPKLEIPVLAPPAKILRFEARTADGKTELCYGVENAASATITPSPGQVKLSAKECVPVAAGAARSYTLTARNAAGVAVTRSLTVEAAPSPPPEQLVTVPNAVGKSRGDAVAELEKAGLEVRIVEEKLDPNASGPVGSVVAQLPKGGERLKSGGRVTLQIMPAPAPAAVASSALPRVGDAWEYRYRSIWKNVAARNYTHQVTAVSEREIRETMSGDKISESKSFNPETRFVEWRGQGYSFVEFNPFIGAFGALQPGTAWKSLAIPVDDPFFGNWSTHGRAADWDSVSVPAGTFRAMRVEINSNRAPTGSVAMRASEPVRILHVIWFAPDTKRVVKLVRTVYGTSGNRLDEDTYELVKYRVQ